MITKDLIKATRIFADKKSTLPTLETVRILADTYTATNVEISYCRQSGEVDQPNGCYSFAQLEQIANNMLIKSDSVASTEEYPLLKEALPSISESHNRTAIGTLNTTKLLNTLEQLLVSCSTDETRYNITGLCFDYQPNSLTLCATDGHRLRWLNGETLGLLASSYLQINPRFDHRIIVPRLGIEKLCKLLKMRKNQDISLYFLGDPKAEFTHLQAILKGPSLGDQELVTIRLIDGQFPDYRQITGHIGPVTATINIDSAKPIIERLKTIKKIVGSKAWSANYAAFIVRFLDTDAWIDTAEHDKLSIFDTLKINEIHASFQPDSIFGMNARYLLEELESLPDPSAPVTIESTANGAGVIIVKRSDDLESIVMPCRFK